MSYQVLARKWRPHTFEDLVGQEPAHSQGCAGREQGARPHDAVGPDGAHDGVDVGQHQGHHDGGGHQGRANALDDLVLGRLDHADEREQQLGRSQRVIGLLRREASTWNSRLMQARASCPSA